MKLKPPTGLIHGTPWKWPPFAPDQFIPFGLFLVMASNAKDLVDPRNYRASGVRQHDVQCRLGSPSVTVTTTARHLTNAILLESSICSCCFGPCFQA